MKALASPQVPCTDRAWLHEGKDVLSDDDGIYSDEPDQYALGFGPVPTAITQTNSVNLIFLFQ